MDLKKDAKLAEICFGSVMSSPSISWDRIWLALTSLPIADLIALHNLLEWFLFSWIRFVPSIKTTFYNCHVVDTKPYGKKTQVTTVWRASGRSTRAVTFGNLRWYLRTTTGVKCPLVLPVKPWCKRWILRLHRILLFLQVSFTFIFNCFWSFQCEHSKR